MGKSLKAVEKKDKNSYYLCRSVSIPIMPCYQMVGMCVPHKGHPSSHLIKWFVLNLEAILPYYRDTKCKHAFKLCEAPCSISVFVCALSSCMSFLKLQ